MPFRELFHRPIYCLPNDLASYERKKHTLSNTEKTNHKKENNVLPNIKINGTGLDKILGCAHINGDNLCSWATKDKKQKKKHRPTRYQGHRKCHIQVLEKLSTNPLFMWTEHVDLTDQISVSGCSVAWFNLWNQSSREKENNAVELRYEEGNILCCWCLDAAAAVLVSLSVGVASPNVTHYEIVLYIALG